MSSKIAILGPGGVGGFLAAVLGRAGEDVVVIAREPSAEQLVQGGIAVESIVFGNFHAWPRVESRLTDSVKYLFVTTKASGLESALERIEHDPSFVIPLLNGIDHLEELRGRFGYGRVLPATIRIEATSPTLGRVVQTSPQVRITFANEPAELQSAVRSLVMQLSDLGISAKVGGSEADVMWGKLVRINTIACCTAASGLSVGELREDPVWLELFHNCAAESVRVAQAAGAAISADVLDQELDALHPALKSSMLRDLEAAREPELEAVPGAVLRAASRYGLDCPTVQHLFEIIEAKT